MNDLTDLNWLHPGQKIRSLVDRSTIKEQHGSLIARLIAAQVAADVTDTETVYVIARVYPHPWRDGWYGITLEGKDPDNVHSLRDPNVDGEPLLWEPVDE